MNAYSPEKLCGRRAELSPLEIRLAETAETAAPWCEAGAGNVSSIELYGCVDWYQYPRQGEHAPEKMAQGIGH